MAVTLDIGAALRDAPECVPFGVMARSGIAIGALAVLLAAACGSESTTRYVTNGDSGVPGSCDPGRSELCIGPAGCQGGQTCNGDGTAWGECLCTDPDAGLECEFWDDQTSANACGLLDRNVPYPRRGAGCETDLNCEKGVRATEEFWCCSYKY